ncbi:unnamed protein product [Porites evermanni]|uniref:Carboxylesterase type B domain-containing protein n=1 Tax=Porites evermanni TaxID=104178 RepID=A0ABN8M2B0_9CNID|nr:unnamed protein product [Porites evermanni]
MTASTLSPWSLHVLLLYLCCRCSVASAIVNTTYGPVNGSVISLSTNKTVITYLGIPFAKAERFEYPVPPDKWTSTLQANKTDKICPQPDLPGQPSRLSLMSEDCLLLNVYVPGNATNNSQLAVMLWIHGGAYIIGDTLFYDGSLLATEGNVIVVTAAYRLGVFGFLSSYSDNLKGNYGMLDQIAALKWVNKNIERFGGDSRKVTIFGESVGGMNVALLLLSPLASGLYQNVIIQSGTAVTLSALFEKDEAELRARSFAENVGCEMASLKACAKKKSFQDLSSAQLKVFDYLNFFRFAPVVDGYFMPDSPIKLLKAGKFNKSNVMIGFTRDDGTVFANGFPGVMPALDLSKGMSRNLFVDVIKNRMWTRNQNSQILDLLIYEYTDWSNATDPYLLRQQFIDMNTDANFKAPAIQSANEFVKKESSTYLYQLEIAPKRFSRSLLPIPSWWGIFHGADIAYTFGFPLLMPKNFTTTAEISFSKEMMTIWANFAKTGNPNRPTPLRTNWPQYTAERGEYMGLSSNMTVRYKMRPNKMALWNVFLPSLGETVKPTTRSDVLTTTGKADDKKDDITMVLGILIGVFVALAVILLSTIFNRNRIKKD